MWSVKQSKQKCYIVPWTDVTFTCESVTIAVFTFHVVLIGGGGGRSKPRNVSVTWRKYSTPIGPVFFFQVYNMWLSTYSLRLFMLNTKRSVFYAESIIYQLFVRFPNYRQLDNRMRLYRARIDDTFSRWPPVSVYHRWRTLASGCFQ